MAPSEARAKFPVKLEDYNGDTSTRPDPNACFELFAGEPVQGVSFLVENAKVGRVDVISEGPKTADGFGVGTPAAAIRTKYGTQITEAPNKYEPEVVELALMQGATKFIFEIQDNSVRAFRARVCKMRSSPASSPRSVMRRALGLCAGLGGRLLRRDMGHGAF